MPGACYSTCSVDGSSEHVRPYGQADRRIYTGCAKKVSPYWCIN